MTKTRLTEKIYFVVNPIENSGDAAITFFCEDRHKTYNQLMVVLFPLGDPPIPPIEQAMAYDVNLGQWSITLNRPSNASEMFYILPNIGPENMLMGPLRAR